ncbi:hypothetical protein ACQBAU_17260 [Propionibacteriaceae bacterium Y2011]|uniref:hypothetical protein n=1 Tax=Microlunatus sp. Y2014 TaxID=3418488 RepID=UPI003B4A3CD7
MGYKARRARRTTLTERLSPYGRKLAPGLVAMALVTGAAVATMPHDGSATGPAATQAVPAASASQPGANQHREERANRSAERTTPPTPTPTPEDQQALLERQAQQHGSISAGGSLERQLVSKGKRWATADLKLRVAPREGAASKGLLATGTRIDVTGITDNGFAEVIHEGVARWVTASYLSESNPATRTPSSSSSSSGGSSSGGSSSGGSSSSGESSSGSEGSGSSGSTAPCPSGSSVEQGLVANAIKVHRDVCHRWPQLTSYGGVRADSMPEHPSGRALDIMISNNATGWEVARYLRANAGRLGISQVIFDQQIWTVQRSGEGWRMMEDRGGATANHRDHVHVTVYG